MPDWTPRLIEAARLSGMFVLVIFGAFLAAKLCWLLISPGPAVSTLTPRPLPSPIQAGAQSSIRADLSLLVTTNPFQANEAAETEIPDAPATQLNLKLVALFMSTGESGGSATIITPNNETTRFELGDDILPSVRLERILSDRVIISREGVEETLMRGGREAGLSVISEPEDVRTEARAVSREDDKTTDAPPAPVTAAATPSAFAPGVTAQTLLASLDPVPQRDGDRLTGFLLRPRGNASLMQSAGLEAGDLLTGINGRNVSEIDTSALATELGATHAARVTVMRNGASRTIDIDFVEG